MNAFVKLFIISLGALAVIWLINPKWVLPAAILLPGIPP